MRQIFLLAEGQTEERFVKMVLAPHLTAYDLHVEPTIVTTKRITAGKNHRGGISSWRKVEREIRYLLRRVARRRGDHHDRPLRPSNGLAWMWAACHWPLRQGGGRRIRHARHDRR